MKTIKQLLRQPFKTAAGIIIAALAFAILVTCVGQYTATELTRENLNDRYDTIGLLSDQYFLEKIPGGTRVLTSLPEETQAWVDETVQTRTDLVKTVSSAGLVSAYIPQLSIINFSRYENGYQMDSTNIGLPYRCAMLEVTLTDIGTIYKENVTWFFVNDERRELVKSITVLCVGTVDRVLGLEQGFQSPVGQKILLRLTVRSKEYLEALNLQIGQKHLVYGLDYSDNAEDEVFKYDRAPYEELFGPLQYRDPLGRFLDYSPVLEQIGCIMTVRDESSLPARAPTYDENGEYSGYALLEDERVLVDSDGIGKYVPAEEYIAKYQVPTITPLNSSAEEFLASEEGTLWQKKLSEMEINNHGFPVVCVEKLGYQAAFSRERARIVEGRDFSESELAGGEKVCIIAQSLANRNGLQVGDTIDLRTYAYDPNVYDFQRAAMSDASAFPSAAIYSEAMGFTSEMESYTIVGLYRQADAWQNPHDPYGFTPNTIFVPKTSVSSEMLTYTKGIFSTLVLHNGKIKEFQALTAEAGYPDLFVCYDQGYSDIMATLDSYQEVSGKALYIGIAAFAAVMLLFLFLYPMQQKRPLALMGALGASGTARFRHTVASTLCILVPGAALGGFAGSKLWTRIAAALMEWINVQITLESDMAAVAPLLTAVSLAAAAIAVLIVSAALCRNRGLMKRK